MGGRKKKKKQKTAVFSGERCVRNNHRNVSFQRFEITRTCTKLNTDQKAGGEIDRSPRKPAQTTLLHLLGASKTAKPSLNEGCFILEYTLCKQRSMNV